MWKEEKKMELRKRIQRRIYNYSLLSLLISLPSPPRPHLPLQPRPLRRQLLKVFLGAGVLLRPSLQHHNVGLPRPLHTHALTLCWEEGMGGEVDQWMSLISFFFPLPSFPPFHSLSPLPHFPPSLSSTHPDAAAPPPAAVPAPSVPALAPSPPPSPPAASPEWMPPSPAPPSAAPPACPDGGKQR